jgi:nucleotide-binding universal stress UspA family protein
MTHDSNPKNRTIVIAVDESPVSKEALEWSVNNLLHKNDNVRLLSVIDSENRPAYGTPGGIPLEIGASDSPDPHQLEQRRKLLLECSNMAKKKTGNVKTSTLVSSSLGTSSDHGREICEFAAENNADILVLGSRGYGSFRRNISAIFGLGSVSNFVVNHATVPNVMIHKQRESTRK